MTPEERTKAFTVATGDSLISMIGRAGRRLVVVAPAVSARIATAIGERWCTLGPDSVAIVLDSDPEVYRLGYGELRGLDILSTAAGELGGAIRHQPGLRIGVVIADDETLVFVPTAELVEAGPNTHSGANAICLTVPPATVATDLGLNGSTKPEIGRSGLSSRDINDVKQNLAANPPQAFNIARKVRVFSSLIEFVELEVLGAEVSRKVLRVPSYLFGVADAQTENQLRAGFQLVPKDHDLSGGAIEQDRRLIAEKYLHVIPRFGSVVLLREKKEFLKDLASLTTAVAAFGARVKDELQQVLDRNRGELVEALTPALVRQPPARWLRSDGARPDDAELRRKLDRTLSAAFGTAGRLVSKMKVRIAFKGVTYELLNDPEFRKAAAKAIPELGDRLHSEFDAAQGQEIPPQSESEPE